MSRFWRLFWVYKLEKEKQGNWVGMKLLLKKLKKKKINNNKTTTNVSERR